MEEEIYKDPVQLAGGIKMSDLTSPGFEFQIDLDFKKKKDSLINGDEDLYPDMDSVENDSETEELLQNLEHSTHKLLLSSPQYHSFEQLASEMVDCVSNGMVKLLILEEGDGPLIPETAEVSLHYAAYWERATIPFDSTLTMNHGNPLRLRLGEGKNIPGLEIGLTHVKGPKARFHLLLQPAVAWGEKEIGLTHMKGPKARFHLLLQPAVAWGEKGVPPRIRPEPVLFVITVYDVTHVFAAQRFNDLPKSEQSRFKTTYETVKTIRSQGKRLFSRKKYHSAIKSYQQAISVLSVSLPETSNEENQLKELKIKIYLNLGVCYMKINKPKYVLNMCSNINILIDIEHHCKGLYLYGKALEMMNNVDEALVYYKKALKLEPKNKEIGKTLAELDEKNKKSNVDEKAMWKKVFNNTETIDSTVYDVDEEFQNGVLDMCQDLNARESYAKIDLSMCLTKKEIDCIKNLIKNFKNLVFLEDGEGSRKNISIVKKAF